MKLGLLIAALFCSANALADCTVVYNSGSDLLTYELQAAGVSYKWADLLEYVGNKGDSSSFQGSLSNITARQSAAKAAVEKIKTLCR
jgi:hypothetical protein